jgi:FkbM family methyltransferase
MRSLFLPFFRMPLAHLRRLFADSHYRTMARLATRHQGATTPRTIKIHGWTLTAPDPQTFLWAYFWIFVEKVYAFTARRPDPLIIDCGANVGLSVLYFKKLYPKSRVIAYEADPRICQTLINNVHGNGFTDVELVNAAVSTSDAPVSFVSDGKDTGRIAVASVDAQKSVETVAGVRLADVLAMHDVDLLKVDIEGAEVDVLLDCRDVLHKCHAVCAEYHSFPGTPQRLGELLTMFEELGFRAQVMHVAHNGSPLVPEQRMNICGMDVQLHLYFYKP